MTYPSHLRAQFEDHFIDKGWKSKQFARDNNGYINHTVQALWVGWIECTHHQPAILRAAGALQIENRMKTGSAVDIDEREKLNAGNSPLPNQGELNDSHEDQIDPESDVQVNIAAIFYLLVGIMLFLALAVFWLLDTSKHEHYHWQAEARTRIKYPALASYFGEFDQCWRLPSRAGFFKTLVSNRDWGECDPKGRTSADAAQLLAFQNSRQMEFGEIVRANDANRPPPAK